MQHDELMAEETSYVQALERQALACEEDNARLRAEIAAVRTRSLSTTLTGHRLILAEERPADRSRVGTTAPTACRGPFGSRFEGKSDSRSPCLLPSGLIQSSLRSDSACEMLNTPSRISRRRSPSWKRVRLRPACPLLRSLV